MSGESSVPDDVDDRISSSASIWFTDFSVHPQEISTLLGLNATQCGVKGAQRVTLKGKPKAGLNERNFWFLNSRLHWSATVEAHIASVLDQLDEARVDLTNLPLGTQAWLCASMIEEAAGVPDIGLDASLLGRILTLGVSLRIRIINVV
jgi:hypothetical protein